jgi:hypothetical protein
MLVSKLCTLARVRYQALALARCFSSPPEAEVDNLPTYEKIDVPQTLIVRKKGHDVIADALFNKGTAFPHAERERLGLRGLLPPRILSLEEQEQRIMRDYREGLDYVSPEEVENWSISRFDSNPKCILVPVASQV